ncbi:hypothetical protein AAC387_Pa08g1519 [Persea americana]
MLHRRSPYLSGWRRCIYVLFFNSLPLPAFSFSSGKWRSCIMEICMDFNGRPPIDDCFVHGGIDLIAMENEVDKVAEKLRGVLWKSFIFYLKVNKIRTDDANQSCPVTKLSDIDYADDSKRLLSLISAA